MNPRYEQLKTRREKQRLNSIGAKSEVSPTSQKSGSELEELGSYKYSQNLEVF